MNDRQHRPQARAEFIASEFHGWYEILAPHHGYETRLESRTAWEDVPENNRALMIDTVAHLLDTGVIQ